MRRKKAPDPIVLKREDLYKEVWSTPILQLAEKYDISDVALAKICRKMCIPRPPRGYWAKFANGQSIRRSPLKSLPDGGRDHFVLDKSAEYIAELERQRQELRLDQEYQRRNIRQLKADLQEFELCQRIRAYLAAMYADEKFDEKDIDYKEKLAWAEQYASVCSSSHTFCGSSGASISRKYRSR